MSLGNATSGVLLIAKRLPKGSHEGLQTIFQKRAKNIIDGVIGDGDLQLPGFYDDTIDDSFSPTLPDMDGPPPSGLSPLPKDKIDENFSEGDGLEYAGPDISDITRGFKSVTFSIIRQDYGDIEPQIIVSGISLPTNLTAEQESGVNPSRPEIIASLNFLPPHASITTTFDDTATSVLVKDLLDLRVGHSRILNKTCYEIFKRINKVVTGIVGHQDTISGNNGLAQSAFKKIDEYYRLSKHYLHLSTHFETYDLSVDIKKGSGVFQKDLNNRMQPHNVSWPIPKSIEDQYYEFCNFSSDNVLRYFTNTKLWNQLVHDVHTACTNHSPTFLRWIGSVQGDSNSTRENEYQVTGPNQLNLSARLTTRPYVPPHAFNPRQYGFRSANFPILPYHDDGWVAFQNQISSLNGDGSTDVNTPLAKAAMMMLTLSKEINMSIYLLAGKKSLGDSSSAAGNNFAPQRIIENYNYDFTSDSNPYQIWDKVLGVKSSNLPFLDAKQNLSYVSTNDDLTTMSITQGETSDALDGPGVYRPVSISGLSIIRGTGAVTGEESTLPFEERHIQLKFGGFKYAYGKEFFFDSFFVPDNNGKLLSSNKIHSYANIFQQNTRHFKGIVDHGLIATHGNECASLNTPESLWKKLLRALSYAMMGVSVTNSQFTLDPSTHGDELTLASGGQNIGYSYIGTAIGDVDPLGNIDFSGELLTAETHRNNMHIMALFQLAGWTEHHGPGPHGGHPEFGPNVYLNPNFEFIDIKGYGYKQLLYHLVLAVKDARRFNDYETPVYEDGEFETPGSYTFPSPDGYDAAAGEKVAYKASSHPSLSDQDIIAEKQIFWGNDNGLLSQNGTSGDRISEIVDKIATMFATQMNIIIHNEKQSGNHDSQYCHAKVQDANSHGGGVSADYLSNYINEGLDSVQKVTATNMPTNANAGPVDGIDLNGEFEEGETLYSVLYGKMFGAVMEDVQAYLDSPSATAGAVIGNSVIGAIVRNIITVENLADYASGKSIFVDNDAANTNRVSWIGTTAAIHKRDIDATSGFEKLTSKCPRVVTNYLGMDGNTMAAFAFEAAFTILSIFPHCYYAIRITPDASYFQLIGNPEANRQLAMMLRWCGRDDGNDHDHNVSGDLYDVMKEQGFDAWDWFSQKGMQPTGNTHSSGYYSANDYPFVQQFETDSFYKSLFADDHSYVLDPMDQGGSPYIEGYDVAYSQHEAIWNTLMINAQNDKLAWHAIARAGWSLRHEHAFLVWSSEAFQRTADRISKLTNDTVAHLHKDLKNDLGLISLPAGTSLPDLVGLEDTGLVPSELSGISHAVYISLLNNSLQQSYLRCHNLLDLFLVSYDVLGTAAGNYTKSRSYGQVPVNDYGRYHGLSTQAAFISKMLTNCLSGGASEQALSLKTDDAVNVKTLVLGIPTGMLDDLQRQTFYDAGGQEYSPVPNGPIAADPAGFSPLDRSYSTIIEIEIHRKDHIYGEIIFEPIKVEFDMSLFVDRKNFGAIPVGTDIKVPDNLTELVSSSRFTKYHLRQGDSENALVSDTKTFTGNSWLYEDMNPFDNNSELRSYEILGTNGTDTLLHRHIISELLMLYYRLLSGIDVSESTFVYKDHAWLHDLYVDKSTTFFLDSVSKGPGNAVGIVKDKTTGENDNKVAQIMPTGTTTFSGLVDGANSQGGYSDVPPQLLTEGYDPLVYIPNVNNNIPDEQMKVLRSLLSSVVFSAGSQSLRQSVSKIFDRVFAVPIDIDSFYIVDENQPANSWWENHKQQLLNEGKIYPVSFSEANAAGLPKEGTYGFNRSGTEDKNDSLFADTLMYKLRLLDAKV